MDRPDHRQWVKVEADVVNVHAARQPSQDGGRCEVGAAGAGCRLKAL
jgi:hypothetical protein